MDVVLSRSVLVAVLFAYVFPDSEGLKDDDEVLREDAAGVSNVDMLSSRRITKQMRLEQEDLRGV